MITDIFFLEFLNHTQEMQTSTGINYVERHERQSHNRSPMHDHVQKFSDGNTYKSKVQNITPAHINMCNLQPIVSSSTALTSIPPHCGMRWDETMHDLPVLPGNIHKCQLHHKNQNHYKTANISPKRALPFECMQLLIQKKPFKVVNVSACIHKEQAVRGK